MPDFHCGDRVRVDIPHEMDPDHQQFHGRHGIVVKTINDDAGRETGDERDSIIYRVDLDDGGEFDVRHSDLRPPIED